MKSKEFLIIIGVIIIGVSSTPMVGALEDKPIIVCTTEVLGSFVRGYLGDKADIIVLVNPSLCPADFDIKPSDVYAISNAKILFKQDIPGEFWLKGLLEASGNQNLTQIAISGVYNTPEGAKKYIERIENNLTNILGIDLSNEKVEMIATIDEVSNWMNEKAIENEASIMKVICMQWQKAFVESAGFKVVATYNPPETLSVSDINKLIKIAEDERVVLIVDNLQIDVEFGKGIADQVGAEHVILTNFPGAIPGTESITEMFQYNADQLYKATVTWKYSYSLREERENLENRVTLYQISTVIAVLLALVEAVYLYAGRRGK